MSTLYLLLAIALEVCGTTMLKLSNGLTRLLPSVLMLVFYVLSLGVFSLALKKIAVSVGYAIWAGLGTALVAVIGVLVFNESMTLWKLVSLILVLAGVVGLNLSSAH